MELSTFGLIVFVIAGIALIVHAHNQYRQKLIVAAAYECYEFLSFEPLILEEAIERIRLDRCEHIYALLHSTVDYAQILAGIYRPVRGIDELEGVIAKLIDFLAECDLVSIREYRLSREVIAVDPWWPRIDALEPHHREPFVAFASSKFIPVNEIPEPYADHYQNSVNAKRTIPLFLIAKKPMRGGKRTPPEKSNEFAGFKPAFV